jgi:hypothetical protein
MIQKNTEHDPIQRQLSVSSHIVSALTGALSLRKPSEDAKDPGGSGHSPRDDAGLAVNSELPKCSYSSSL